MLGGASACSVAADDGSLAGADGDRSGEAVESTAQALALRSDPELAGFLAALHAAEITEAQLALTRAQDPYVIEFAKLMQAHHTAASQALAAALTNLRIAPVDSPISLAIVEQAAAEAELLQGLAGEVFDWTYMNLQVQTHRELLSELQEQLADVGVGWQPGIANLIPDLRSAASRHLALATSIVSSLGVPYGPVNYLPPSPVTHYPPGAGYPPRNTPPGAGYPPYYGYGAPGGAGYPPHSTSSSWLYPYSGYRP